eukprot:6475759-Pyramimonas_sp.AAC.1
MPAPTRHSSSPRQTKEGRSSPRGKFSQPLFAAISGRFFFTGTISGAVATASTSDVSSGAHPRRILADRATGAHLRDGA